ncbi:hypothetical protein [Marinimicrobium sp. ABcell2]|uniref:PA4575 family protein n=1 Tax=Marinimicrobium sp. ABcell2 TaxID=3069751 RepID=UPI0027B6935E|nr:hypothetical protein [Marinimicrobium sp. ABcell2]MDQ2076916.1 hypothetical protein [Marinimicrobium sp. ABcell2]
MRLRYDKTIPADPAPLVLTKPEGQRVEIHIRVDSDGSATLLAFGGREHQSPPDKTTQQGPFLVFDQAVAAKRAIVAQLKDAGYKVADDQYPLWSMAVQRSMNELRKHKQETAVDYRFDPKDVFLDW